MDYFENNGLRRIARIALIIFLQELPEIDHSPTDNTDGHRFFLNNGLHGFFFLQELSEIDHELTMRSALVTLCLQRINQEL